MNRRTGLLITGCTVGLALIVGLLAFFSIRSLHERALAYEIPAGFKGWIFIQYGDSSCPPLQRKGEVRVLSIPPSGRVCTSDHRAEGIFSAQFEYVYPDGRRTNLPWSTSSGGEALVRMLTYDPKDKTEIDFVGNKDEFMHAGAPPYPWRPSASPQ